MIKSISQNNRYRVILAGLVSVAFTACTPKAPSTLEKLGGEEPGLFSNRQINQDEFIAVVKLKSAPLLSQASRDANGKTILDADLVKQIDAEQAQAIQDLKDLSSDIRVIYKYRMVLNGFAIVAPIALKDKLKERLHVSYVESQGSFGRPVTFDNNHSLIRSLLNNGDSTSVEFIGGPAAHQQGITGKGMKVGIVDTGIDYTHAMLGGVGTSEAFKANDPSAVSDAFPNAKVVGGIDLVGTEYNSGSGDYSKHIPVPDENPIDEGGHGTHVAGTVAGIGDGVETYSGVAPDALLHSIKVFGADGSTGDAVVIAGLEYAADPNRDANLEDQLDVINMSLGSSYGTPHVLYEEAIGNLSNGGTVVVASAGNSGNFDYIVGAPSIVEEAISVAASVDDMPHNWKFAGVKFEAGAENFIAEAIQGPITKPIKDAGEVIGKLVHVGLAAEDFSAEVAASVRGNVALIDRGAVTFAEKVKRAHLAGAIGVIVANNQPSAPIAMGGDGSFDIPGIMINQALGMTLKAKIAAGESVVVYFQTDEKIEKPELIDTLTGFSSKGPRSIDGLLKPEISAPGANIISAKMGGGKAGVPMSGTSMAGPHVAGVMALLKQAYPKLNSLELKSILMGHGKTIGDEKKSDYLLSRQGAGRVQIEPSLHALVVAKQVAFSLGELNIEGKKVIAKDLNIKSLAKLSLKVKLEFVGDKGLSLDGVPEFNLDPEETKDLKLKLRVDVSGLAPEVEELDGFVNVLALGRVIHRIPVLAVVKRISNVVATDLNILADSEVSSAGAVAEIKIQNKGQQAGVALPFNLLGVDSRKQDTRSDKFMSKFCDLQAVGYKIVDKVVEGQKLKVLQIGVKTYDAMTTWNMCEVSVLLDVNGDQVAEQELGAIQLGNVKGISTANNEQMFASVLFDAAKMRDIRMKFELDSAKGEKVNDESYASAVVDMLLIQPFMRSSVMVVEADVTKLVRRPEGHVAIKVATIFNDPNSVEMDDFLKDDATNWEIVSLQEESQPYVHLPETVSLKAGEAMTIEFDKGQAKGDLLLLFPDNRTVKSDVLQDDQMQILSPKFGL